MREYPVKKVGAGIGKFGNSDPPIEGLIDTSLMTQKCACTFHAFLDCKLQQTIWHTSQRTLVSHFLLKSVKK